MDSHENEMRAQFEAAYTAYCEELGWKTYTAFHMLSEVYVRESTELAWKMWKASRQAFVVELKRYSTNCGDRYRDPGHGDTLDYEETVSAIESQGVKCK